VAGRGAYHRYFELVEGLEALLQRPVERQIEIWGEALSLAMQDDASLDVQTRSDGPHGAAT